jgi:thiazole synthase
MSEVSVMLNGKPRTVADGVSLLDLLEQLNVQPSRVVVEHNRQIRRHDDFETTRVHAGDELELVYFVGGGSMNGDDPFVVGGRILRSRLIHGTGKFTSNEVLARCLAAAEPDMITVAIRRLQIDPLGEPTGRDEARAGGHSELEGIDLRRYTLLPNTAGATTAEGAVRLARLARAAGFSDFIKVEVIGDEDTLLPDPHATLEATRQLVKEGFIVMPYTSDDVVQAIRLYEAGAAAIMPGAAPIGTTLGLQNLLNLELIISKVSVPVIVDAGLGVPSEAARCMEIGAAAVLVNTAIARAQDPPEMARAFSEAVVAGRRAFRAGRARIGLKAVASSPVEGIPV